MTVRFVALRTHRTQHRVPPLPSQRRCRQRRGNRNIMNARAPATCDRVEKVGHSPPLLQQFYRAFAVSHLAYELMDRIGFRTTP